MKPKECVNSDCTEIFYVEDHKLDLPLQCEKCITKKELGLTPLKEKDDKGNN